ncbi:hypothetical protein DAPPUDRAFT_244549 [Daphnia pulex]|uniref:Uncharacterized protein n=1 Tax=Daphnia pulex TaxID=6669 RepID=E9GL70_DAPPU|nr:hypothetical protein DAPPUDRAFT_244549 [Daphnia pulex]|eukprot:EFX79845.1 hypothetical protein DAPPUDRAFT_244549 [Daphnia pulex]
MSFEHEYQIAMPTPYYTTTAYASAGYYTIRHQGITPQLMIPQATAPTPYFQHFVLVGMGPIPISDVNLQKDRPVCFEGHGNHYVKRVMWCRAYYNVLLLSDFVLLMAGSTTSVPMSFGYGYQTAMPTPPIPIPSNVNLQKEKGVHMAFTFGEAHVYYTTIASECYMVIYAALNYYTEASKCYTINVWRILNGNATVLLHNIRNDLLLQRTSNYYTEKAEYYTRTCATPVYYIEEPKHYSAPSYNRSVYYTTIDPDCYAAPNRYIEASKYYTIEDYYDVLLLLGVVSWMTGFTMSVPMSPGYGGFQVPAAIEYFTRLLPYYLTTSTYA